MYNDTVRTFNSVHKPAGPPGRFHAQACDRRSAVWVSIHSGKSGVLRRPRHPGGSALAAGSGVRVVIPNNLVPVTIRQMASRGALHEETYVRT